MTLDLFPLIVSIAGILLGLLNTWLIFVVKSFRQDVEALRAADTSMAAQVGELKTLLAGNYVLRADFKEDMRIQTAALTDAMTRMEIRLTERIRGGSV